MSKLINVIFILAVLFSVPINLQSQQSDTVYTVVISSLKNTKNAQDFALKLEALGFKVQILKMNTHLGVMNRVCIEKSDSHDSIGILEKSVKTKLKDNKGWVLEILDYQTVLMDSKAVNITEYGKNETKEAITFKLTEPLKENIVKNDTLTNKTYTIVVTSLKNASNAVNFAKELEKIGFNVNVMKIETPKGEMNRVCVGTVNSKKEAKSIQSKLKDHNYSTGWILTLDKPKEKNNSKNTPVSNMNQFAKNETNIIEKITEKPIFQKNAKTGYEITKVDKPKEENNIKQTTEDDKGIIAKNEIAIPDKVLKAIEKHRLKKEGKQDNISIPNNNQTYNIQDAPVISSNNEQINKPQEIQSPLIPETITIYNPNDLIPNTDWTFQKMGDEIKKICYALENYSIENKAIITDKIDNIYGSYILYNEDGKLRYSEIATLEKIFKNSMIEKQLNDFYRDLYKVRKQNYLFTNLPNFDCDLKTITGSQLYIKDCKGYPEFTNKLLATVDLNGKEISEEEMEKYLVAGISINSIAKIGGATFIKALYFSIEGERLFLRCIDIQNPCPNFNNQFSKQVE